MVPYRYLFNIFFRKFIIKTQRSRFLPPKDLFSINIWQEKKEHSSLKKKKKNWQEDCSGRYRTPRHNRQFKSGDFFLPYSNLHTNAIIFNIKKSWLNDKYFDLEQLFRGFGSEQLSRRGMRHISTALYFYGASKKTLHKSTVTFGNML
jgi:hypothetical protein